MRAARVFLTVQEVAALMGVSVQGIYYRAKNDSSFPQRHYLSPRRVVWRNREVVRWLNRKKKAAECAT